MRDEFDELDLRTCRLCGCDDLHACDDGPVACSWVLLDIHEPSGVCSSCAKSVGWDSFELAGYPLVAHSSELPIAGQIFFHRGIDGSMHGSIGDENV